METTKTKWIIHLDLDSFYASVEVLDNPELKGKPLIVGGLGPRGVVSTASYAARAFGVRSGIPVSVAKRLCPQVICLRVRMERYKELSGKVMGIFRRHTPLVEPLSLDEAYLDVTDYVSPSLSATMIASEIKREVFSETSLTISAGVATQKQLAKIASGMNKPDALTVVPEGEELNFLWPLDLKELWGVGKVTLEKLRAMGLSTIKDLAHVPLEKMIQGFGVRGKELWLLANAKDYREVIPERETKSVGAETTFDYDIYGREKVLEALSDLSLKVSGRLRKASLFGYTLTLKLRDRNFKTITRSRTSEYPLADPRAIYSLARNLFQKESQGPFRLLGIQISKLSEPGEPMIVPERPRPLFGEESLVYPSEFPDYPEFPDGPEFPDCPDDPDDPDYFMVYSSRETGLASPEEARLEPPGDSSGGDPMVAPDNDPPEGPRGLPAEDSEDVDPTEDPDYERRRD
jgi:DNA polymerase-4